MRNLGFVSHSFLGSLPEVLVLQVWGAPEALCFQKGTGDTDAASLRSTLKGAWLTPKNKTCTCTDPIRWGFLVGGMVGVGGC